MHISGTAILLPIRNIKQYYYHEVSVIHCITSTNENYSNNKVKCNNMSIISYLHYSCNILYTYIYVFYNIEYPVCVPMQNNV